MTFLVPPLAMEAVSAPSTSIYVSGFPVAALLLLLILVVAKQTSVNVSTARFRRLSRCLDVGVAPLTIAALVISASEVARVLR